MNSFDITYEFAEKYIRFSRPEYIQMYMYVKYYMHKNGEFPKSDIISRELDMAQERVIFILDFWVSRDELVYDELGYHFPDKTEKKASKANTDVLQKRKKVSKKPSYTMQEIDGVAASNKAVSALFYQAETVLNKVLTPSDMEMLYSFVDWLGLPVEVITMLLSYAAKKGKVGRRYLETVAIDWADRGIDSFEAAEAHISQLESLDSAEREIRNILGIYDRSLTQTEKKYIGQWVENPAVSPELIPVAYDRTVQNTGKLSWAYMNKILLSWAENGITTLKQLETFEEDFKGQPPKSKQAKVPSKNKFNNYEDTNQLDYSKLEEQLLDMMLDN